MSDFTSTLGSGNENRVPTTQGKWQQEIPVRENTGNLEILLHMGKTHGILCTQAVNSPT